MQPGYPGSGQDPSAPQPPNPFDTPGYGQYPAQPYPTQPPASGQPYADPYATPGVPYAAPTSGQPYAAPISGQPYPQQPYPQPPYPQPASGQPYYQQPTPGYDPNYAYQAPVVYPGGYTVPAAPAAGRNNTLGLLALIFGIAAIPLSVCCNFLGAPLGIAGVVLGILGMNKAKQGLADNRGMALAGLICGAVGVVLSVGFIILSLVLNTSGFFYSRY